MKKAPAMMIRALRSQHLLAILTVPALWAISGCGDDGLPSRYSVSGKVTYKGEPVQKGKISFVPEVESGRGATGEIVDGNYTLTTQDPGDGAIPGKYKVVVDTRQVDEAALKAATEKFAEKRKIEGLQSIPQEVQGKILSQTKSLTPTKYMSPQSTPLTEEVKAQSNTINIDLAD